MRAIEELRRMYEDADYWKHRRPLGKLEAVPQDGATPAMVLASDGDPVLYAAPHPMLDHDAVARLAAGALTLLPALLDVAEAAAVALKHLPAEDPTRERFSEVVRDTQALRTALARLEEGT